MHNINHCLYNEDHLWCLHRDNDSAIIGISDHAQQRVGRIHQVELPTAGSSVNRGKPFGTLISGGIVIELVSPVDGRIINANNYLDYSPAAVNSDPYGEGWMLHVQLEAAEQLCELMSSEQYTQYIAERDSIAVEWAFA